MDTEAFSPGGNHFFPGGGGGGGRIGVENLHIIILPFLKFFFFTTIYI